MTMMGYFDDVGPQVLHRSSFSHINFSFICKPCNTLCMQV